MTARTEKIAVLSERESRILGMLAGRTQYQVAKELGFTKQHVSQVVGKLRKLGLAGPDSKPTPNAELAGLMWEIAEKMRQSGAVVVARGLE